MITTAWRGAYKKNEVGDPNKGCYGLKVPIDDREKYFEKDWDYIVLELEGNVQEFKVNINKSSFWGPSCRELIHKSIKQWFLKNNISPWERGKPPRIRLEKINNNRFKALLDK